MHKRGRIIEIRGFKGILTAIFIFCCIVTGFTVFPGFIAMNIWNLLTPYINNMPQMNLLHGVMLWAICFLIWFAFKGKMPSMHFGCAPAMNDEEIREFVEQIKKEQQQKEENENIQNSEEK